MFSALFCLICDLKSLNPISPNVDAGFTLKPYAMLGETPMAIREVAKALF
jgi:hypothetical protein